MPTGAGGWRGTTRRTDGHARPAADLASTRVGTGAGGRDPFTIGLRSGHGDVRRVPARDQPRGEPEVPQGGDRPGDRGGRFHRRGDVHQHRQRPFDTTRGRAPRSRRRSRTPTAPRPGSRCRRSCSPPRSCGRSPRRPRLRPRRRHYVSLLKEPPSAAAIKAMEEASTVERGRQGGWPGGAPALPRQQLRYGCQADQRPGREAARRRDQPQPDGGQCAGGEVVLTTRSPAAGRAPSGTAA